MNPDEQTQWNTAPETWDRLKPAAREMRHTATPEEDMVWDRLRNRRFLGLKFRRQHAVGPFIVDFYCHEKRLIIEIDGGVHESTRERDAVRQRFLEASGFRVVRVSNREVHDDIERALANVLGSGT